MSNTRLPVIVRYMTRDDIDQVLLIDRLSFPRPWPEHVYHQELSHFNRSKLFILERTDISPSPNGGQPNGPLAWILKPRPAADEAAPATQIGYSGLWQVADESHISTIAIHPDWRGRKLGELLIWMMVRQAIRHNSRIITLEVRVSNHVAQNLYRKYGFEILNRRKGYYSDNREDAFTMGVTPLDDTYREKVLTFGKALSTHLRVIDQC